MRLAQSRSRTYYLWCNNKTKISEPAPMLAPVPDSLQRCIIYAASNSRISMRVVDPTNGNKLHLVDTSEAVEAMSRGTAAEKKRFLYCKDQP